MTLQSINGVLLLNKPLGLSSNQALQKVKKLYHAKKAGHTGSLDPLATGMLPICFGDATKFSQFMLDADKGYTAVGQLGKTTTTQDAEGDIVQVCDWQHITEAQLKHTLSTFIGEQQQVPSMFSAIKQNGIPLYKLARKGIEVERKSRDITVHSLELVECDLPNFKIKVSCSKGTYIRNLVEDIGNALNVGAYVVSLHRDYSAPFNDMPMVSLQAVEQSEAPLALLYNVQQMVANTPKIEITEKQRQSLYHGQKLRDISHLCVGATDQVYRVFDNEGHFYGVGEFDADGSFKSKKLISI
jgi:tRNA pseudouridine55 synthase